MVQWSCCLAAALLLFAQPLRVEASNKDDFTGLVQLNAEVIEGLKPQDKPGKSLDDVVALAQQKTVPLKDLAKMIRSMVDVDLEGKGPEICGYVNQIATPMNTMLAISLDNARAQMEKVLNRTTQAEKPLLERIGRMGMNASQRVAMFRSLVNATVGSALSSMHKVGGPGMQTLLGTAIPILNASTQALSRMGLESAAKKMNTTLWYGKEKSELIVAVIRKAPAAIANYTDQKAKEYKNKLKKLDANVTVVMKAQMAAFDDYVNSWRDLIMAMTKDARVNLTAMVPKECLKSVTAPLDSIEYSVANVSSQVVEVVHRLGHMVLEAESKAVSQVGLVEAGSAAHSTFGINDEVLDMAEMYATEVGQLVNSHYGQMGWFMTHKPKMRDNSEKARKGDKKEEANKSDKKKKAAEKDDAEQAEEQDKFFEEGQRDDDEEDEVEESDTKVEKSKLKVEKSDAHVKESDNKDKVKKNYIKMEKSDNKVEKSDKKEEAHKSDKKKKVAEKDDDEQAEEQDEEGQRDDDEDDEVEESDTKVEKSKTKVEKSDAHVKESDNEEKVKKTYVKVEKSDNQVEKSDKEEREDDLGSSDLDEDIAEDVEAESKGEVKKEKVKKEEQHQEPPKKMMQSLLGELEKRADAGADKSAHAGAAAKRDAAKGGKKAAK